MICVDSNGQAIEISVADQMWLDDAYFKGKQIHLEADAPRVALAYRVSTKGQVDHDDIPMQKIDCRKFAQKQGWRVVKEVAEKGVSGSKVSASKRDAIQQLKEEAANGEFDILLVYMFDRLGRIESETPFVLEWFVQHGIQMWSTYYDDFRGWAEEFDAAPLEMKRMILSHLIDRVEVGRKYQVTIKLNMEYQQLLDNTVEAICEEGLETQRK